MRPFRQHTQQGSMLLEALIAIVIFSIGILAIVGLQANSIRISSDAKFRADASLLANQYLSSMWVDMAAAVTTAGAFSATEFVAFNTGGANFNNWLNSVVVPALPNASATVTATTVLTCNNNVCPPNPSGVQQSSATNVNITINWTLPSGTTHTYSTIALVSAQKQL